MVVNTAVTASARSRKP